MKMTKILIAICLMLLLATPVMALDMGMQTCTGIGYRSANGTIAGWAEEKLVMQISERMVVLLKGGGDIEPSSDIQTYEVGAEFGIFITNRLMARINTSYHRTDISDDNVTDIESALISMGVDYYFTDVFKDKNEIIGVTLSITHNQNTKETGLFAGAVFWFGKDNASK